MKELASIHYTFFLEKVIFNCAWNGISRTQYAQHFFWTQFYCFFFFFFSFRLWWTYVRETATCRQFRRRQGRFFSKQEWNHKTKEEIERGRETRNTIQKIIFYVRASEIKCFLFVSFSLKISWNKKIESAIQLSSVVESFSKFSVIDEGGWHNLKTKPRFNW